MCRGIREAKFTWVGSKYRPRNKIRTLAWALLQASPGPKVLPGLVPSTEVRRSACLSCSSQNVMNVSKEATRGISFSLPLYLFLSIMIMDRVYFLDGSREIKRWRAKRQRRLRGGLQERGFVPLLLCCFVFVFLRVSKQLSSVPGGCKTQKTLQLT